MAHQPGAPAAARARGCARPTAAGWATLPQRSWRHAGGLPSPSGSRSGPPTTSRCACPRAPPTPHHRGPLAPPSKLPRGVPELCWRCLPAAQTKFNAARGVTKADDASFLGMYVAACDTAGAAAGKPGAGCLRRLFEGTVSRSVHVECTGGAGSGTVREQQGVSPGAAAPWSSPCQDAWLARACTLRAPCIPSARCAGTRRQSRHRAP